MGNIRLSWPNIRDLGDGLFTSGQPSETDIERAACEGIRTVVNLCGEGECGWDEAAVVEDAGMRYVHIPVCGPQDICEDKSRELDKVLCDPTLYPMVVHCGSGNRVGGLFALRAFHCQGKSVDDAVKAGKDAGMTGAEAHVRACLS